MPNVTRNVRSGDQNIDGLLVDNKWATHELTFSFPTAAFQWTGYGPGEEPYDNFEDLNATQRAVVRDVLVEISSVANIAFTAASGGGGDLRFGMSDMPETAYAYTPTSAVWGGDSWYNNSNRDYDNPVRGNYAYHTFIHEIGHALGMKHPHETDIFGAMPRQHDAMEFTVMSYRSYPGASVGDDGGYTNETWGFAQSLMMYDIAALQHMYGANYSTNAGDTVYGWSPTTGELSIDGVGQGAPGANRVFMTIWDGGGIDTYDLSGYATPLFVDLRPGEWVRTSDVQRANLGDGHQARGNIANALLFNDDARSLIENAVGGTGDDRFVGNEGVNRLIGGAGNDSFEDVGGNDYIDGGEGADGMDGGPGDDTYVVDNAGDQVSETSGNGRDTVRSAIDFALPGAVEDLILTGSAAIDGRGNGAENRIVGNNAANRLSGGPGGDVLVGNGGADVYVVDDRGDRIVESLASGGIDEAETSVSFQLSAHVENLVLTGSGDINGGGNGLANRIVGNAGANRLNGYQGADVMLGGDGDDLYVIDNRGDRAVESSASGGVDRVRSGVSIGLRSNVENLDLTGGGDINGGGNDLANRIVGNAGGNRLNGYAGADTMLGGDGNDLYIIDDRGDRAVESSDSGGVDWVRSGVSIGLRSHVENLNLAGDGDINGGGNDLANRIAGNSGANLINGYAGADVMRGRDGDDLYIVDDGGDRALEASASGGIDRVKSSADFHIGRYVENLDLIGTGAVDGSGNTDDNRVNGNGAANVLDGRGGADVLAGRGGDDSLHGGAGDDRMEGGGGADGFYFDVHLANAGVDHILDFSAAADTIFLDETVFHGIGLGTLSDDAFHAGSSAGDAQDRIVYDAAAGQLFYDPDGTGAAAATLFATVTPGTDLTHADFNIYP